jgi:hypothetical protein
MGLEPLRRRPLFALVLFAALAARPGAAQPPAFQVLAWAFQETHPLPPSSHFGDRLALQRDGDLLLVAAPDGGVRSRHHFSDSTGWTSGVPTFSTPQFFELAGDSGGVAYTLDQGDGTTDIRRQLPSGAVETVLEGITGFVTAIAKEGGRLAVGEAAHAAGAGRVRVYELEPILGFVLRATFVGTSGAALGRSLALDGALLAAGAPGEGDCGAVHVFAEVMSSTAAETGPTWIDLQTIDCPSASQVDADFGQSVALSGDLLAVGAPRLDRPNPGGGPDFGGIYTFRPNGLLFELETFLRPSEADEGDRFGSSVALFRLAGSPNVALFAGSPFEDGANVDSGATYLYLDWGDAWKKQLRLAPEFAESDARLGAQVAIGAMGVVAGVPRNDGNGVGDQGVVFAWNGVVPLFYDGFGRGDSSAWTGEVP